MARMLPPDVRAGYPSQGEVEIFRQLRDDPRTADWFVLHSLYLAEAGRRAAGEVDFVAIIPEKGVVCLEVKGCSAANLRRENGLWFYGPDDPGDPRSPFRQASDGMHSLRRRVVGEHADLRGVLFTAGVAFPFAPFSENSVEWSDWQVIDSRALRKERLSTLLVRLADAARRHLLDLPNPPSLSLSSPTAEQCLALRDILRGDFEVPVDARVRARTLADELARYTADQFIALDGMTDNPRAVFTGPAGTGKTLLAIEAARRCHASGRRSLFVCFNRLLGAWLEDQTVTLCPLVTTGTLHRHMLAVSGVRQAPAGVTPRFWETDLPELACNRLLAEESAEHVFDELVIDEAQDLLRPSYLDFLDLSVRGGLADGRWRMFGDFERQAIYGAATLKVDQFLSTWAKSAPRFSLRDNCRNTPLTVSWIHHLAGLKPPYSRVRRPDDRVSPQIEFYASPADQERLLADTLARIQRSGFRPEDIIVLSPRADGSCAAALELDGWSARLQPLGSAGRRRIGHTTIQAFKGLEAPSIVVTDIESIIGEDAQALLYVAITRSVQRLIILAHKRVREQCARVLLGGPTETSGQESRAK